MIIDQRGPRRISSEGPSNGYFSGGKSFMSNGYVIWRRGLDGEYPNPYGVAQGEKIAQAMFYTRSMDKRSSFYRLVQFLQTIQQKEAAKEKDFMEKKVKSMHKDLPGDGEYEAAIWRAIDAENYGLAYTLMLDRNKDLKEFKRELKSSYFNNISHMNSFWADQFSTYFAKRITELVDIKDHQLIGNIMANQNLTIGTIVDDWFQEKMTGSDGLVKESFEPLREAMKKQLLEFYKAAKIEGVESYNDNIFGTKGNITKLSKHKTTKKVRSSEDKTISGFVTEISAAIGNAVGRGISSEFAAAVKAGATGATAINTGTWLKTIKNEFSNTNRTVQQKADDIFIELFRGSIDIKQVANEFYQQLIEDPAKNIEQLQNKLNSYLEENEVDDVFMVEVNVKGYRSKRNLSIEGEGSFAARASNLVKMSQEAQGIPELSMEKLIFMLNNTVSGCLQDNRKEYIAEYLTAICVAWMWDDYTELFSVDEMAKGGKVKKIRLFSSGGFFYSASQILQLGIDNLVTRAPGTDFVDVEINPPEFDADSMYRGLKKVYPTPPRNASKEAWQSALKPRWDDMKSYVMANGTMSISIEQAKLEKLLDDLYLILGM